MHTQPCPAHQHCYSTKPAGSTMACTHSPCPAHTALSSSPSLLPTRALPAFAPPPLPPSSSSSSSAASYALLIISCICTSHESVCWYVCLCVCLCVSVCVCVCAHACLRTFITHVHILQFVGTERPGMESYALGSNQAPSRGLYEHGAVRARSIKYEAHLVIVHGLGRLLTAAAAATLALAVAAAG